MINEQVTSEEARVIKELALVPAVAELAGAPYGPPTIWFTTLPFRSSTLGSLQWLI